MDNKSNSESQQSTKKVAFITGIGGQDGSYLAEFLLGKNYEVHGMIRRSSYFNTGRINHLYHNTKTHDTGTQDGKSAFKLHYGDMTDTSCLANLMATIRPDEIYNLAAQSHVQVSFEMSEYTADVDALGVLRLLEAIRICKLENKVRLYQASTSEMFGGREEDGVPQSELTPFHPRSPYGVAKLYGYWIVVNFRESYNIYACNGILFNHESPRRGENFVTRKITRSVAKISLGLQDCVVLGNLDSKRDWGHAKDYVEAMWLMLQQEGVPKDYVISTRETTSVRQFVIMAFKEIGIDIIWEGEGLTEVGKDKKTGRVLVKVDEKYFRPAEVDVLLGDCTKALQELKWKPKYDLNMLVKEMMEEDLKLMKSNPNA